jgi:tetratricopeptide (TPR) repeat protein/tRNA A-37 threonylcarbamoyl transferase component Bud32
MGDADIMIQRTGPDPKLRELLIIWEETRERGESLTVDRLCRDCPELADELARQIQALRDWDPLTPGLAAPSTRSCGPSTQALDSAPASACVTVRLSDLHFHDQGGLGTIYKARHKDLPRDVALKFIRPDRADDPQCSKRLLREARITARLEHPGIVPIYGLGRDESGNPCYAMRFVEGTTLEQAIDQYHARQDQGRERQSAGTDREFRALLQRFKSACTTVGYAHSRGVLHRDIKPANIMLGPFDETLVLDWGLGKILAGDDAEVPREPEQRPSLFSSGPDELETCGVIGTPGFMSPEQHAGQWENVGRSSDIFGLGATLYVLLTGKRPFDGGGPGEIAARLERGAFAPPRQVRPEVPRPLEAICLKAMALAPQDRYRSAIDLADDLEDWISDEPVRAWTEPWHVRARRWTRRHRTVVTAGAVAALLAMIGLIAILVQQDRSNRHLAARNEELRQSRARAERRVELALKAIDQFRGAVADNPQLKLRPEFAPLRRGLLRAPQEFYRRIQQDIEDSHDTSPEAWTGLASVIVRLAEITAEIDSRPGAIHAYQEGLAVIDRLLVERPDADVLRAMQGRVLLELGKLQRDEGNLPDAVARQERALRIFEALCGDQPEAADRRIDLAGACDEVGMTYGRAARLGEAEARFEQARKILENLQDQPVQGTKHLGRLAQVYNHLGIAHRNSGRLDQALALYERALVIQAQLARERPADPWIRSNLAAFHYNIGNLRRDAGTSGAIECYERANEILEPLVRDYRSMVDFRMMYARSLGNLAMLTSSWQTEVRAIPAYTRVADLQREGVELHPGVVRFRLDLATTLFHLARAHIEVDQPRDALRHAREGTETLESVLSTDTDTTGQVRSLLGRTWQKRAEALVALGDEKEAVEALRAAIREQGKAFEPGHRSDDFAALLFEHHYHLVAVHCLRGQAQDAAASLEAMEPLWSDDPAILFSQVRETARGWYDASGREAGRTRRTGTATQLYGALLVTMLERSREAGFRDFSRLIHDPAFEPFRAREDFQRLLLRMMDLAFPIEALSR